LNRNALIEPASVAIIRKRRTMIQIQQDNEQKLLEKNQKTLEKNQLQDAKNKEKEVT
jgi:hypothetical protein